MARSAPLARSTGRPPRWAVAGVAVSVALWVNGPAALGVDADTTPPQTTIETGPLGPVTEAVATFTFSASEPGSTFECRIDSAPFASCSSSATFTSLAPGRHTFEARAIDPVGNRDPSPAARRFTIVRCSITGTEGPDTLTGTSRGDVICGFGGNDVLRGFDGDDTLVGGAGNDRLFGGSGADVLGGNDGDDQLDGGGGADVLTGGNGSDRVTYTDRVAPLAVTIGNGSDDGETGEKDNVHDDIERVTGGAGDDRLTGNAQANVLIGGPGNDLLLGGAGDDTLQGMAGADVLRGESGADLADYGERTATVTVTIGTGPDDGDREERDDVGSDVERVRGGKGDDWLTGGPFADVLEGNAGADVLDGGGGQDELLGSDGDDRLVARDGEFDRLVCGVGGDRYEADGVDWLGTDCETGLYRPNIVLIVTDDQSFESVAKMPYLSSRTGWYRFDNAFINNATCCPSRATIETGQWSHHHGVEGTGGAPPFDDSATLATWLDEAGYRTAFVGKYHLGTAERTPVTYIPPGWDEWQAFARTTAGWYYDYTLNENGTLVDYGSDADDYSTDVLARKALDFIEETAAAPFFLYFAPRAPHNGWIPAPRHIGAFADAPVEHSPNFNEADMSDKPTYWQNLPLRKEPDNDGARRKQWATLLAMDEAVEAIVEAIEAQGEFDDTIVMFMTDNGYAFAEHRHQGKVCAYDECSRTPLLVSYLGHAEGYAFPQMIGNEDIAPTLADLAGVVPGALGDGDSFASTLRTGVVAPRWPDEVLLRGYRPPSDMSNPPEFWAIRTREFKYVETVLTGEVELYDLVADPYELDNVTGHAEYAAVVAELAARLAEMRTRPMRTMEVAPPW